MVEVKNIFFSYTENQKVLNDISFSLSKGETLAIVGASGCGKSTLLRIISGLLPNDEGSVLNGKVLVDKMRSNQYRKNGNLSFMFQEPTLMPNLNVKQNVGLPLEIKREFNSEKVDYLIKSVGLEAASSFLPKQLSGGMKTRVALARSFTTMPELLLLDEPFASLDIAWKSKLYVELEALREEMRTTVIIVTHDVQEALLLADQIVVMNSLGGIEARMDIKSDFTILDRVQNISKYMNTVYESYMLPIQDAIMNGEN